MVRNFIPRIDDDPLPPNLRAQFESLQHLISQQKLDRTETDDELTLGSSTSRSDHDDTVVTQMALSTAISAQREIDCLLNGITELENMLNTDVHDHHDSRHEHAHGHSYHNNRSNNRDPAVVVIINNDHTNDQHHEKQARKSSSMGGKGKSSSTVK